MTPPKIPHRHAALAAGDVPLTTILDLCTPAQRAKVLNTLPAPYLRRWDHTFWEWAHGGQKTPVGNWRTWVLMAGRGFGKTRAGSEWVLSLVRRNEGLGPAADTRNAISIALVAATLDEARSIMVEGASGLLARARPDEIEKFSATQRTLRFRNGAQATLFSGSSPEGLRGPEHHYAWCDELAKWHCGQDTWDNLQLGLRSGPCPQALVTTTPRTGTVLARIIEEPGTVLTSGPTHDNLHLPAAFLDAVTARYAGTRLGMQELEGKLLTDVEGSLWPRARIEACRAAVTMIDCTRIVIGVDPPASVSGTCGIVVCGLRNDGCVAVLADASVSGASPERWAQAVAQAAIDWGADRVIVEGNQGGDMAISVLRAAKANLPVRKVHAARGKTARAEPIATLFENGSAVFGGVFPALEAELTGLQIGGGYAGPGNSPDRADAMVWALWALTIAAGGEPTMRWLDL